MSEPKFKIDDQVWAVSSTTSHEDIPCPAGCIEGKIQLKDGSYNCPRCRGSGVDYNYVPKTEVSKNPLYITGVVFSCKKSGNKREANKLTTNCRYYCMEDIDPHHSVYEDSNGDLRFDENALFATQEEAVKVAAELEIKMLEDLKKEQEKRDRYNGHD